jgi:lipid-A-disaccharide synthase
VNKRVLLIAGEISGDMHAAKLVREVRAIDPDISFYGIGGDLLEAEGVKVQYHVRDMAVLGLSEVLRRYGFFRRVFHDLIRSVEKDPPDAVVLVDYPGFNLRFARQMERRGIKVIYYICPQVWAWKRGRIPKMAQWIDRLMVIFPFEVDLFKGYDIEVQYVGHPLVNAVQSFKDSGIAAQLSWDASRKLALLPGSRRQEIERILPDMLEAVRVLHTEDPDLGCILAAASPEIAADMDAVLVAFPDLAEVVRVEIDQTRAVLLRADAAMVASGTATLETALCTCPMIVVYRTAAFTYAVGRRVVKIPHIGMVNIVAGKGVCPEFIQDAVRPADLAAAVSPLLTDTEARAVMLQELEAVKVLLSEHPGAEAAELVVADVWA